MIEVLMRIAKLMNRFESLVKELLELFIKLRENLMVRKLLLKESSKTLSILIENS